MRKFRRRINSDLSECEMEDTSFRSDGVPMSASLSSASDAPTVVRYLFCPENAVETPIE
jgi:hypothetical protein